MPHDRITGLHKGEEGSQVGVGAAVGLYVGMFRTEQLAGSLPGQFFHFIHEFAAAIVPVTGISLCVFVGEDRPHGLHHSRRDEVLRKRSVRSYAVVFPVLLR